MKKEVLKWYPKECKRVQGRLQERRVDEIRKMCGLRWMRGDERYNINEYKLVGDAFIQLWTTNDWK